MFLRVGTVFLAFAQCFVPGRARAISPQVQQLVDYETQSNAMAARSNRSISLENFEIPLDLLEVDLAERMDPRIRESLIFERDGKKYVRWIINPEDTLWYKDVEHFLEARHISTERHHYFSAYKTASRSYIIEDPHNGATFSAKVSTNQTAGIWLEKKQVVADARQIRKISDYLSETAAKFDRSRRLVILDEPAMFGITHGIDQAMVVRSLGELNANHRIRYLPGFSAVHESTGARIARLNGAENVAEYWNEHYNKPLARAMAEFATLYGMTHESPHSQNFLVELDANLKPTGRIVFRDVSDTFVSRPWFESIGRADILKIWYPDYILNNHLEVNIGLFGGGKLPSWMSEEEHKKWVMDYYREFERSFSAASGIPQKELKVPFVYEDNHYKKKYPQNSKAWQNFFVHAPRKHVARPFWCLQYLNTLVGELP